MPDDDVIALQMPADQNHPVTGERVLLGAHQRYALGLHGLPQPANPLPEDFPGGKALVLDLSVFVAG